MTVPASGGPMSDERLAEIRERAERHIKGCDSIFDHPRRPDREFAYQQIRVLSLQLLDEVEAELASCRAVLSRYEEERNQAFNVEEWSERERRLMDHFAVAMHGLTCGDWGAAGNETRQSFRIAAAYAVVALNGEGHDLLDILPPSARAALEAGE